MSLDLACPADFIKLGHSDTTVAETLIFRVQLSKAKQLQKKAQQPFEYFKLYVVLPGVTLE